jgi:chromosome segregation protein
LKLKELQMFGFKSFADKTRLEFGEGITIIVGPNGSGKSNIMDAIRWVLGEQSAKALRGGKMEDVIFIGSDSRKTLGMAEVSMVMDNTDRAINLLYNEIKVSRRLYRSGESEYFINDNPVRLKDILELFMDTGVGIDSYSIISQGEVERIISAKPLERREIFEEAAGITKYIKRRDEALRKLETTEQHMLRINDILAEVKRQESALERQAKKAEKYRELKQECGDMEIRMYKKDIKEKSNEYKKYSAESGDYGKKIEEEDARLRAHELKYEEQKLNAASMEREMAQKKEKRLIAEQEIKRLEDGRKFLDEKKAELEARIGALKSENVESVGRIEGLKADVASKEKLLGEKLAAVKAKEAELNGLNGEVARLAGEYEAKKRERDEKAGFFEKFTEELNNLKNRMTAQDAAIKNVVERIAAYDSESVEIQEKLKRVNLELETISGNRVLKEEEIKHIKEKEEQLIKEKMHKKEELGSVENTLRELGLVISRLEARFNVLKKMHERLEGYGETVRKVLTEYRTQLEDAKKSGIAGAVGNLITVEKRFESAVEKALRDTLQSVLVRGTAFIDEIFSLYEKEKGGINLLDSSAQNVDHKAILSSWKKTVTHKNILSYLPDAVSVPPGMEIIKLLFYNIFITEDAAKAKEVIRDTGPAGQYFLLTLNGEMISNFGLYRKGEGEIGEGAGFLSREREISEIEREILAARGKSGSVESEKKLLSGKIEGMEKEIESLSIIYHNQYVEVIKDDERIKQRQSDREAIIKAGEKAARDRGESENARRDLGAASEAMEIEKKNMESELDKIKAEVEALKMDIESREDELNKRKGAQEAVRIEILKAKNDHEFESNNMLIIKNKITEIESQYSGTIKEIEDLRTRAVQAEEEKKAGEGRIAGHKTELAGAESELNLKRDEYERFTIDMEKFGAGIKEMGRERDRLKDAQYSVKLKINELSLEVKTIYEKVEQEYKLSLGEEEISAVEMGEEEYRELSMKVAEYRGKMDTLGVINLVAIEEYNELKKRNEFLQAQYDDLIRARDNLNKVIKKTNEESKELFNKAFVEIRARFIEVFKKMMNGGEADLLLTDSENILAAGIDIIARPPGKRLQNMMLLSGGEKSITAVSLLFALFLIKASPFCIMDEVDAALDDINVARFTNLVKSFKKTQFLVISHNKLTMETADVIYGVSMEKAGVSRIMSVRLENIDRVMPAGTVGDGK